MPYYKNCHKVCVKPSRHSRHRRCTKAWKCTNKVTARRRARRRRH